MSRSVARPPLAVTALALTGLVGAVLIVLGADRVGALASPAPRPVMPSLARLAFFGGLALLVLSWLVILRRVLAHEDERVWPLRLTGWLWALPMLFAKPIDSRDLWAYAAQGNVLAHGLDPYRVGPAAAPGGFARTVDAQYRHAVSPYGPLWSQLSHAAVALAGRHVVVAVLLLRLLAALGLLLVSLTIGRLSAAGGRRPDLALTLFCLNPLVIVVGLGGGHNDLLMVGLVSLGLSLACRPGPAWVMLAGASVVLTLAVAIKLPAVIALAFLPLVWWWRSAHERDRPPLRSLWWAVAVVVLAAAVTGGVLTAATGLPDGWLVTVNADVRGLIWLSVPVGLLLIARYFQGTPAAQLTEIGAHAQAQLGRIAVVLAILTLPPMWLTARGRNPLPWLAGAFAIGTVLSTTIYSWYGFAPLLIVAVLALTRRYVVLLAGVAMWLTITVQPAGNYVTTRLVAVPLLGLALVLSWALLREPKAPAEPR